jgi:heptosyltransferase-2
MKEKIANIIKNKLLITINPSSAWETKRWPDYKFIKLVEEIYNRYSVPVIFTGSKKENEYISGMEKLLGNKCINMAGKTTLSELIYLIKESDLLITNDSGPMHIASATSTPVLAIFGPTTRELGFFPYGSRSVVMGSSLRCRPCTLHGSKNCPHGHLLCMKMIKVSDVLNEVEKILKYKYE